MRCLVVSDNPAFASQICNRLQDLGHDCPCSRILSVELVTAQLQTVAENGTLRKPPLGHTSAVEPSPAQAPYDVAAEVVVLVLPSEMERAWKVLRELRRRTVAHVFAVGPATNSKVLLRTLREGAHEYLDQDEWEAELAAALERIAAQLVSEAPHGRLIGLLAPNGGSGSSTLAVNLAAALAKSQVSCALVDMKLHAGDLAPLLDLKPDYTLVDLCRNLGKVDESMLEAALIRHRSGIRLLAAPAGLADTSSVTPEAIRRILTLLVQLCPWVVLDLDHSYHPEQLQALRQAGLVLLVLRLDFTSLRHIRRKLDYLEEMGIRQERIRLVVNRYGQPYEVAAGEAEQALGVKIAHYVPEDAKTCNWAHNHGVPLVLQFSSTKVARSITELAKQLRACFP